MAADIQTLRPYLHDFDLTGLMVEGLGWNHHQGTPITVIADDESYNLRTVAEKANFAAYRCSPKPDGNIPPQSARRQIENQVSKTNYEHLIIFVDAAKTRQVWQWVKRESSRPPAVRELRYDKGQTGTALLQRLRGIEFTLEEEGNLGIIDVTERFQQSLDVERVTNRFYKRFRDELTAFQTFIGGFNSQGDRDWYASLMLNRMMFIYFIQKQGFLDGDEHYLGNRLKKVQEQDGPDQFMRFYRKFLLRLFHEGLGQPEADRSVELTALLGKVPYLNGGIFDPHPLELDNPDINIPDAAFEQIFLFFDQYQWHLDDRPSGADNEINPDVLGYIFEKYVNQKQIGAYYTKEDITGYIARNTVIPRLLEIAQTECPIAFGPDGGVWRLLQDDPDNYIYPAVGHGIAWDYSPESVSRLEKPLPLPDHITRGLDDTAQRADWNKAAPGEYALPTETWRELFARRQRYSEVRDKLAAGDVQSVNDLVTLNLDSERFVRDVIVNSEGPELVRAIWNALTNISVLDPACGSGAFLFAALNVIEPLYSATMQAMRDFLTDLETSRRQRPPEALRDFRNILDAAGQHSNERYYILKSIIVNNLYGVDIMEEAVEICRLRLFLKLAAQIKTYDQIEPLPDIDFNIQAGNSLVGFTSAASVRMAMEVDIRGQRRMMTPDVEAALRRIEAKAAGIALEYQVFQQIQTEYGMSYTELAQSKQDLQSKLNDLRGELDALLAKEYGVDANKATAFQQWQASHQPFHWFVEFHGIIHQGGFDVIVGNPPYVEYSNVKSEYTVKGYATESCGNLYAYLMERCKTLANQRAHLSMIVPLSGHSTKRMTPLVDKFYEQFKSCHLMNISGDANPSRLFPGVKFRLAVFVVSNSGEGMFTSGYTHFYADERDTLFSLLSYTDIGDLRYETAIPKVSSILHRQVLKKLNSHRTTWLEARHSLGNEVLYHSAPVNWIRAHTCTPYFHSERDGEKKSTELKSLYLEPDSAPCLHSILCSTTFFIWWSSHSDCYHLNKPEILKFPMLSVDGLNSIARKLEADMQTHSKRRVYNYKTTGRVEYDEFYLKLSKPIIDEIDQVLAEHYGFTDEELDFIINYDIKYRMGRS